MSMTTRPRWSRPRWRSTLWRSSRDSWRSSKASRTSTPSPAKLHEADAALVSIWVQATTDRQFGTNSYLIEDADTKDAVIIDANLEPGLMIDLVGKRDANVKAIMLTHTDIDHVAGLSALIAELGSIPVAVHDEERHVLTEGKPLRREFGASTGPFENVVNLVEGEKFRAGSLQFDVLHTPGHSPGGVTL